MPEIPDLEAIRGFLNERLPGQTVASAEVKIPHVVRTGAAALAESLPGDAFGETDRRGKFLLFALASGRVLAVNPMLTGRFHYGEAGAGGRGRTCLRLALSGGAELRYSDLRLMGRLYLLPADGLDAIPNWTAGGPDLLDAALTEEVWLERIRKYRGRIKNVLTKAEFVQGVGNAYGDEILWEARINPFTPRTALDDDDLRRLLAAARAVMAWATPLARERMVRGGTLDYAERRDFFRVHRLGGEARCPRDGARITDIEAGGRVTSFCRACQPGGPAFS